MDSTSDDKKKRHSLEDPTERSYILEDHGTIKQMSIDENQDLKPPHAKSSFWGVTFNYVNSIIGSGVIGIPFILKEAGVLVGLIVLLIIAFVGDYSLILIVRAGHKSGRTSYQGVMEAAFGKIGYVLLSLIQFAFPFIAMVSYNVIVGDTITRVFARLLGYDILWARDIVTLVTSLVLTLPLSLYKNIGKLSKASFLSFLLIVFIIISVFVRLPYYRTIVPPQDEDWTLMNASGILTAISIATFAFVCHHNTFFLYESMIDPEIMKWRKVTHTSVGISLITMGTLGISGYATFTSTIQGDLLNNYCWSDDLMNVSRVFFALTILLTYPLECFACREVMKMVIWRKGQLQLMDPKQATMWHFLVTVSIVIVTYLLSTLTDCLGIVLELNGLLAAIPLAFILPALCYLKLEDGSIFSTQKLGSLALAVFGIVATIIGIVQLIIEGIDECEPGSAMPYCKGDVYPVLNATALEYVQF